MRTITTEYAADGGRIISDLSRDGGTKNTYDRAGTLVKTEALDKYGHIKTKWCIEAAINVSNNLFDLYNIHQA